VTAAELAAMTLAREAMAHVPDGARIIVGSMTGEPRHLMRALEEHAATLRHVDVWSGMLLSDYSFLRAPSIRFTTWFPPGMVGRRSIPPGRLEHLPLSWSQVTATLIELAPESIVMVQVAPADEDGYHSLGLSAGHIGAIIDDAKLVLAEVNPNLPRTRGRRVHRSRLAVAIPSDTPVPEFPASPHSDVDRRIAEFVVDLLEDEVTLQIGVGSVPDACLALAAAKGLRGLRIHSGATEGIIELFERGALAAGENSVRVGEILGSRRLYDFVADNPVIELVDSRLTHTARELCRIERLYCVNSAASVDVFGQVNCEYVHAQHRGAVGGLADFAHAGSWPGNRSIIALRSTTTGERESRIVASLDAATVSLSRDLAQFVVTEYGVADLRGATVRERRERLSAIAHPKFRASLC
jgi:4-hydroxybutyrate CoA-transferase